MARSHYAMVAAALAAAIAVAPAAAQSGRLSLSERVSRLEQQLQGQGEADSQLELLQRINQLQTEVAALRNMVEQQAFEIEALKARSRDQYVDLDSRLARLEGGAPAATAPAIAVPDVEGRVGPTSPPSIPAPEPVDAAAGGPADPAAAEAPAPANERQAYESAFDSLKEGRYAEAARRFQGFLEAYPQGEYAPNAQYWLGESYYVTQNYQVALDAFRALLTRYPDSPKAPDALLKVGYSLYELRRFDEAETVLNQVVEQYPDTTVARLAQARLRALRLENRGG